MDKIIMDKIMFAVWKSSAIVSSSDDFIKGLWAYFPGKEHMRFFSSEFFDFKKLNPIKEEVIK